MALIVCYECGGEVSDAALFCPHCGCPPEVKKVQAVFKYRNGDIYRGEHKGNYRHGVGIYTWANGRTYEGTYAENIRDGEGVYTDENGEKHIQMWVNGKAARLVRQDYKSGDYYIGEVTDIRKNGWGKYFWKSGDCFTGYWEDNKRHGLGVFKQADGDTVFQKWNEDVLEKQSTISMEDLDCDDEDNEFADYDT